MKKIKIGGFEVELSKFHPCLVYNEGLGMLSVHLRDCSHTEVMIERPFDILMDNHFRKKQRAVVGFNLWGARGVLHDQGYTRSSISLEHLINRFERYHKLPHGVSVFGKYKKQILEIARKHQFVWWIPE